MAYGIVNGLNLGFLNRLAKALSTYFLSKTIAFAILASSFASFNGATDFSDFWTLPYDY
jgi:hypothetical protein